MLTKQAAQLMAEIQQLTSQCKQALTKLEPFLAADGDDAALANEIYQFLVNAEDELLSASKTIIERTTFGP